MPAILTHFLCGESSLKLLEATELKKVISKNKRAFYLGTQGPDIFFYYPPCLFRRNIFMLGEILHSSGVNKFFYEYLIYLDKLKDDNDKCVAASYIAGYLSHYVLDGMAHPYVYYKSGFVTDNDVNSKKAYLVSHIKFEKNLDILMLERQHNIAPSGIKIFKMFMLKKEDERIISIMLARAISYSVNAKISPKSVNGAINSMALAYKTLQNYGIKRKRQLEFLEDFFIHENMFSSLMPEDVASTDRDFLNLAKENWSYPWDESSEINKTFYEIFDDAASTSAGLMESLAKFLRHEVTAKDFSAEIGNNSFSTGLNSDNDYPFVIHEMDI